MKKIIISLSIALVAIASNAQGVTDALTFGNTNYYGTARSMALGNAVTAVGGDLGSVGINPAGAAIFNYSQLTFSPGLTSSNTSAAYSQSNSVGLGDDGRYSPVGEGFASSNRDRYSKWSLPNLGTSLYYETGYAHGLKSLTFSFLSNNTDSYVNRFVGGGYNDRTSMLGSFATIATYNADGIGGALDLSGLGEDANPYDYFNREALAAYYSYMINPDGQGGYAGATQSVRRGNGPDQYKLAGKIGQNAIVQKYGAKHDVIFNIAGNYDDKLYVGLNIGVPLFNYSSDEFFYETASDSEQFPVSLEQEDGSTRVYNFVRADYAYNYHASGEGIYAKVGIIYLPDDNVRLGMAIQTPTAYTVDEEWSVAASTEYSGFSNSAKNVPLWNYRYNYRSPWMFNLGAALTIGERCLLSMDYELEDYSVMRFSEYEQYYNDYSDIFYKENRINQLFCGSSSSFRFGVEYRITPAISLRYGFNSKSSPERYYEDNEGMLIDASLYDMWYEDYESGDYTLDRRFKVNATRTAHSFGAGYASNGSFFADFALRFTRYPQTFYSPYGRYLVEDGEYVDSPLLSVSRKVCDAVLTLGWRF